MFPKSDRFIQNYLDQIQNSDHSVYFGGLEYRTEKPEKAQLLRWVSGKVGKKFRCPNDKLIRMIIV